MKKCIVNRSVGRGFQWVSMMVMIAAFVGIPSIGANELPENNQVPEDNVFRLEVVLPDGWSKPSKARLSLTDGERELATRELLLTPESDPAHWEVELPADVLPTLSLASEELWARPLSLSPDMADARVELQPASKLTGTVQPAPSSSESGVGTLFVRLSDATSSLPGTKAQVYDLDCPVEASGHWQCAAPAGHFHIRLSADAHIPKYLWQVDLPAGQERALDPVRLEKGASVAGWVTTSFSDSADLTRATIELRPLAADDPRRHMNGNHETLGLRTLETRPDTRGFFQVSGIAPGVYELAAGGPGWSDAVLAPVEVVADAESRVTEPLELAPQAATEWVLDPPFLPDGMPWSLSLIDPKMHRPVREGQTDLSGSWAVQGLSAGDYVLVVSDGQGARHSRILVQPTRLEPGDHTRFLSIPIVEVEGVLTARDEPVTGTLWLGGRFGATSIPMDVDEEGSFSGFVPREGRWAVDVAVDGMAAVQSLDPVDLERPSYGGPVLLDIELPDTRVAGWVVDGQDRPVAAAQIRLIDFESKSKVAEATGDLDGRFELEGVRPGRFKAYASAAEGESTLVDVAVEEGRYAPDLRLTVESQRMLSGSVSSPEGPVPGAFLAVSPSRRLGTQQQAVTGGDGRFQVQIPSNVDSLDVLVLAPSHALAAYRLAVSDDSTSLDLTVERSAAQLELDLGDHRLSDVSLLANGVLIGGRRLQQWLQLSGRPLEPAAGLPERITVPRVAPGTYSLCPGRGLEYLAAAAVPDGCRGLYLAPAGVGRLAAHSQPRSSTTLASSNASIDRQNVSEVRSEE